MEDTGSGLDYGTRPDRMLGDIVGTDRFFVRSHADTPVIDATGWKLQITGDAVRQPISLSYDDLCTGFPLTSIVRTIECAGNRRVQFGREVGQP
ncbi:molybdopterin-dependent oxidoreductase, partial [Mycolicibacterium gadium]